MERVREAIGLDRGRRREQALRRHLAAVEGLARPVVGVAAAEEVAVDPLEGQQRAPGPRPARGPSVPLALRCVRVRPAPSPPTSRSGARRARGSRRSCACGAILGQTKRSTLGTTRRPAARPAGRPARHARPGPPGRGSGRPPPRPAPRPEPGTTGHRRRDGGRAPRRQVAAPRREVPEVAPHDGRVDVVVVEAPGHGRRRSAPRLGGSSSASAGPLVKTPSDGAASRGTHGSDERRRARARSAGACAPRCSRARRCRRSRGSAPAARRSGTRPSTARCRSSPGSRPGRARRSGCPPPASAAPRLRRPRLAATTGVYDSRSGSCWELSPDAEVVDRDEDPAPLRVPVRLGAAGRARADPRCSSPASSRRPAWRSRRRGPAGDLVGRR